MHFFHLISSALLDHRVASQMTPRLIWPLPFFPLCHPSLSRYGSHSLPVWKVNLSPGPSLRNCDRLRNPIRLIKWWLYNYSNGTCAINLLLPEKDKWVDLGHQHMGDKCQSVHSNTGWKKDLGKKVDQKSFPLKLVLALQRRHLVRENKCCCCCCLECCGPSILGRWWNIFYSDAESLFMPLWMWPFQRIIRWINADPSLRLNSHSHLKGLKALGSKMTLKTLWNSWVIKTYPPFLLSLWTRLAVVSGAVMLIPVMC